MRMPMTHLSPFRHFKQPQRRHHSPFHRQNQSRQWSCRFPRSTRSKFWQRYRRLLGRPAPHLLLKRSEAPLWPSTVVTGKLLSVWSTTSRISSSKATSTSSAYSTDPQSHCILVRDPTTPPSSATLRKSRNGTRFPPKWSSTLLTFPPHPHRHQSRRK